MAESMKQFGRYSTPSSGRKWKARLTDDEEIIPVDVEEAEMVPVLRQSDSASNVRMKLMEEYIKELEVKMNNIQK